MGPDWWMASDGRWYPPEFHPSKTSTPAAEPAAVPQEATSADGWRVGPVDEPDRYTLHERHSRGKEGDLWRAGLTIDDVEIPIALKVTHPEDVDDLDAAKARWQRQAELLRSLEHPALVKVRDLFFGPAPHRPGSSDPGTTVLCMAMNWVDGQRLDDWVKANPARTLDDVLPLLEVIASALDYLHTGVGGRAVLHRNLKPGNILVEGTDVRLVGFGTARLLKLDAQMTIVGTPAWMPPEVLNGDPYDQAADLWSLGAIAYYLITGSPPPLLSIEKARDGLAASPLLAGHPGLLDVIVALLDPTPGQRPASAGTALTEARAAMAAPPAPPAPPPAEPVPALPPAPEPPAPIALDKPADLAPPVDLGPVPAPLDTPTAVPLEPPLPPAPPLDAPTPDPWGGSAPAAEAYPPAPEPLPAPPAEPTAPVDIILAADPVPLGDPTPTGQAVPGDMGPGDVGPGEPVWDEATQSWRDPVSGAVWDPTSQTWLTTEAPAPTPQPVPLEPVTDAPYGASPPAAVPGGYGDAPLPPPAPADSANRAPLLIGLAVGLGVVVLLIIVLLVL